MTPRVSSTELLKRTIWSIDKPLATKAAWTEHFCFWMRKSRRLALNVNVLITAFAHFAFLFATQLLTDTDKDTLTLPEPFTH
jgi:hypothetical protein